MKVIKRIFIDICCIVFLNVVLFHHALGYSQETLHPKNTELLSSLVTKTAHEVIGHLELNPDDSVRIREENENNKIEQFILNRFYQAFSEAGIRIFVFGDSVTHGLILSPHVLEAGVKYEKFSGRSLFKSRKIVRKAELHLCMRVLDAMSGQLVWLKDMENCVEDEIPVSLLSAVEAGGAVLGRPALPEERGFRQWFEPVFVLGVIGAITYLFYIIRSS
jgi:hypothetical protein